MHYKKDGSLDMRYSSSKAAVARSSAPSSTRSSYSAPQAYSSPSSVFGFQSGHSGASAGLHYKKDGTLDMRYSSSKSAASAPAPARVPAPAPQHDLHYKKDGSLDMRYTSSRAASSATQPAIHTKKDGTLDMRYASSRSAVAAASAQTPASKPSHQPLHFKKDGSLDMRYASSKAVAAAARSGRPSEGGLHYKKDGTLDMRYASSKRVELEREMANLQVHSSAVPSAEGWSTGDGVHSAREAYYQSLAQENEAYRRLVEQLAVQEVPCQATEVLPYSGEVATYLRAHHMSTCEASAGAVVSSTNTGKGTTSVDGNSRASTDHADAVDAARLATVTNALPSTIRRLSKDEVEAAITGYEELGKGAFGMVYKGKLDDRDVAVKVLYLSQLQRNERGAFEKELIILGHLGAHENLVQLHAYSLEKPSFLMELVALGSLHHNLYFNNDETVTATLGTSGTKKKVLVGILSGIKQLHHVGIVHGDLKPHNVLLTEDFVAKVTDFGLAHLRAKASSLTGSSQEASGDSTAPIVAGTSAYMAPELLDGNVEASPRTDMYSLGVLFNELCVEEDPYCEHYRRFLGKGPYAATLFAKEGHRPRQTWQTGRGAAMCNALIDRCWHADPAERPTAAELLDLVLAPVCVLPSLTAAVVIAVKDSNA